ncbi:hypothetical protein OPT61_g8227 [Boeremia exigua]|uniref:Uncharacterized protein n=1 Tax=Boeremia exigua TaxID=749465 RepID=A0ACC2HZ42_9PLEO|nr:hypothetical protein OPT61_g8227 [Boeremia exigua]
MTESISCMRLNSSNPPDRSTIYPQLSITRAAHQVQQDSAGSATLEFSSIPVVESYQKTHVAALNGMTRCGPCTRVIDSDSKASLAIALSAQRPDFFAPRSTPGVDAGIRGWHGPFEAHEGGVACAQQGPDTSSPRAHALTRKRPDNWTMCQSRLLCSLDTACFSRAEALCDAITPSNDDPDPAAGDGYLSTILKVVKMDGAPPSTMNAANDYATSAAKELTIREQTAGLIKTTQDIATLIRDLQELWLFGGLDTLQNPADEEAQKKKADEVAGIIEVLAQQKPVTKLEDQEDAIAPAAEGSDDSRQRYGMECSVAAQPSVNMRAKACNALVAILKDAKMAYSLEDEPCMTQPVTNDQRQIRYLGGFSSRKTKRKNSLPTKPSTSTTSLTPQPPMIRSDHFEFEPFPSMVWTTRPPCSGPAQNPKRTLTRAQHHSIKRGRFLILKYGSADMAARALRIAAEKHRSQYLSDLRKEGYKLLTVDDGLAYRLVVGQSLGHMVSVMQQLVGIRGAALEQAEGIERLKALFLWQQDMAATLANEAMYPFRLFQNSQDNISADLRHTPLASTRALGMQSQALDNELRLLLNDLFLYKNISSSTFLKRYELAKRPGYTASLKARVPVYTLWAQCENLISSTKNTSPALKLLQKPLKGFLSQLRGFNPVCNKADIDLASIALRRQSTKYGRQQNVFNALHHHFKWARSKSQYHHLSFRAWWSQICKDRTKARRDAERMSHARQNLDKVAMGIDQLKSGWDQIMFVYYSEFLPVWNTSIKLMSPRELACQDCVAQRYWLFRIQQVEQLEKRWMITRPNPRLRGLNKKRRKARRQRRKSRSTNHQEQGANSGYSITQLSAQDKKPEYTASILHRANSAALKASPIRHGRKTAGYRIRKYMGQFPVPARKQPLDLITVKRKLERRQSVNFNPAVFATTPPRSTLTMTDNLTRAGSGFTGDNPTADPSTHPHLSSLHRSSSRKLPSLVHRNHERSNPKPTATRLLDYSSSEDEVQETKIPGKRKVAAQDILKSRPRLYKSTDLVDSTSDSNSDGTDRNTSATSTSNNMNRMNSLSWGASASQPPRITRKRPQPPQPPTAVKRPKTGPFCPDTDSESSGDSEDDDDDDYEDNVKESDFDSRISVTRSPAKRDTRSKFPSAIDEETNMVSSRFGVQRHESNAGSERGLSLPRFATAPQAVNQDRLDMMIAQKFGKGQAQSSAQRVPKISPQTQSMDSAHASISQQRHLRASFAEHNELTAGVPYHGIDTRKRLGMRQQDVHSPSFRAAPSLPSLPKASNTRSHNGPNSSDLHSAMRTTRAEPERKPKAGRSEWRKAQAARVSKNGGKEVRRPEAGARYGHTLTARVANALEVPMSTNGSFPAQSGGNRVIENQKILQTPSSDTARNQVPRQNIRSVSASNATAPVELSNEISQSRSTHGARQSNEMNFSGHSSPSKTSQKAVYSVPRAATEQANTLPSLDDSNGSNDFNGGSKRTSHPTPLPIALSPSAGAAPEAIISSQSPSKVGHGIHSRHPAALPSDGKGCQRDIQEGSTSNTMKPCSLDYDPVAPGHENAQPDTYTDPASSKPQEVYTTDASNSSNNSAEGKLPKNMPVAVMVCPEKNLDQASNLCYGSEETNVRDSGAFDTASDCNATLPEVNNNVSSNGKAETQNQDSSKMTTPSMFATKIEEVPSLPELADKRDGQPKPVASGQATCMLSPVPSDAVTLEIQPPRSPELSKKVSLETAETASSKQGAAGEVEPTKNLGEGHSTSDTCIPAPLRPVVAPAEHPTPIPEKPQGVDSTSPSQVTGTPCLVELCPVRTVEPERSTTCLPESANALQPHNLALSEQTCKPRSYSTPPNNNSNYAACSAKHPPPSSTPTASPPTPPHSKPTKTPAKPSP